MISANLAPNRVRLIPEVDLYMSIYGSFSLAAYVINFNSANFYWL